MVFKSYGDFSGAKATMMVCIVDDAELAWGDAMDWRLGMDNERIGRSPLQPGRMIIRGMPDFKGDLNRRKRLSQEMKVMDWEISLIGRIRIISMRYIENIITYILLDHKPGAT